MNIIITGMLALAAFVFSANAQETGKEKFKDHGRYHDQKHWMSKDLNLSAEQKEQMKAIHEATKNQLMELNKDENITVKESKARKEAIRKEQKEKINNLLTAQQKAQIAKNKEAQKEKYVTMRAKRLDEMKTKLNLSDEQVAQIKASHEAQRAKAEAIRGNEQLSKEERMQQLSTLRGENKNELKKILNEEQLLKLEQMKKERTNRSK
jgi:Spy/CpxP family protein refolding chaperone